MPFAAATKKLYFEIVDRFLNEYNRRFVENESLLQSLESFNLSSSASEFLNESKLEFIIEQYKKHIFDLELIYDQIRVSRNVLINFNQNCIFLMLEHLETMPVAFSEVIKLFKLSLTLPVTTVTDERFFSLLLRVKSYLRSSMGDERLSNLMLMASEAEMVKQFNIDDLINDFADLKSRRYPLN